jgi:SHS2 domain-containing protein
MSSGYWEHLPHGADVTVCGIGGSKAEAFEQAALALTAVVTDPNSIAADLDVGIACEAADDELLLVEWLNSLLYEMATRKMLFSQFEVHIDGCKLTAKLRGEAINVLRHEPGVEVKGATCTNLKVAQELSGQWRAQCVVDV